MKHVSVQLKTGGHCIHCAAQIEFRRIAQLIMESTEETVPPVLAEQLELLTEFLENTDFNALRASDPRFEGIKTGYCILTRGADNKPVISVSDDFKISIFTKSMGRLAP